MADASGGGVTHTETLVTGPGVGGVRIRSASPCRRALAMDMRRLANLLREPSSHAAQSVTQCPPGMAAWEASDRGASGSTPVRAAASPQQQLVSSLAEQVAQLGASQRQADADRRRLLNVERRLEVLGEERSRDAEGREKWAEVQGVVAGLMEELQALSRRVDGLDERLWARTSVNGLSKQRNRELEQQVQVLEQQSRVAAVANEDVQKRHSAKLRRVEAQHEELLRRVAKVEEDAWLRGEAPNGVTFDQLQELQEQQERLDIDMRGLQVQMDEALQELGAMGNANSLPIPEIHASEQGLMQLEKRLGSQIEDLASSMASLRVKVDGQLQRSSTLAERLQTAQEPWIESLRNEVAHARAQSRREMDQELLVVRERLQQLSQHVEESSGDRPEHRPHLDGNVTGAHGIIQAMDSRLRSCEDDVLEVRNLLLEGQGLRHVAASEADAIGLMRSRVDRIEEYIDGHSASLVHREHGGDDKADAMLLQVQESVCQVQEELARIRERETGESSMSWDLKQQVHSIHSKLVQQERPAQRMVELEAKFNEVTKRLSELGARLLEVEGGLELARDSAMGAADGPPSFATPGGGQNEGERIELLKLQEQLEGVAAYLEMLDDFGTRLVTVETRLKEQPDQQEIGEVLQEAKAELREAKRALEHRTEHDRQHETGEAFRGRDPAPQPLDDRLIKEANEVLQALPLELDQIRLMKVELKNTMKGMRDLESRVQQAVTNLASPTKEALSPTVLKLEEEVKHLGEGLSKLHDRSSGSAVKAPDLAETLNEIMDVKDKCNESVSSLRQDVEASAATAAEESERLTRGLERLQATEEKALWFEHELRQWSKEMPQFSTLKAQIVSISEKQASSAQTWERRLQALETNVKEADTADSMSLQPQVSELAKQASANAESLAEHRRELDGTLASLHGLSDRLATLSSLPEKVDALSREASSHAADSTRAARHHDGAGSPVGNDEHVRTQVQIKAAALTARISEELGSFHEHQNQLDSARTSLKDLSAKVDLLTEKQASEVEERFQKVETTVTRVSREMEQLLGPRRVGIIAGDASPGGLGVAEARALREQLDTVCDQVKDMQSKLVQKNAASPATSDPEASFNLSFTEQVGNNASRDGSLNLSNTDLAKDEVAGCQQNDSSEPVEPEPSGQAPVQGSTGQNSGLDALDKMLGGLSGSPSTSKSGSSSTSQRSRMGQEKRKPHPLNADDSCDSRLSPVAEEGDVEDQPGTAASSSKVPSFSDTKGIRLAGSGSLESQSGDSLGVSYSCQDMGAGVDFSVDDSLELEKCDHIEDVQISPTSATRRSASATDQADSAGGATTLTGLLASGTSSVASSTDTAALSAKGVPTSGAKGASGLAPIARRPTAGILGTSDIASASQPTVAAGPTSTPGVRISAASGGNAGAADEAWDYAQDQSASYDEGSFEDEESVEESIDVESASSSQ